MNEHHPRTDGGSETTHNLNESADKIRLSTKVKRGTGTRDQDTHTVKVRGETPSEAAANLSGVIAELEKRDVFERVRTLEIDESATEGDA